MDLHTTFEMGPAAQATLKALDWASLTTFVADFASTKAGKQACQSMQVRVSSGLHTALLVLWQCVSRQDCSRYMTARPGLSRQPKRAAA